MSSTFWRLQALVILSLAFAFDDPGHLPPVGSVADPLCTGSGRDAARALDPPWLPKWDACADSYASELAATFPDVRPVAALRAQLSRPNATCATTTEAPLLVIAPGSSGTGSLFEAAAFLGIAAKHNGDVRGAGWRSVRHARASKALDLDDAHLFARGCEGAGCAFVADNPVPWTWPRLWSRAPNARFVMIDFDAEKWHAKRLGFRYCDQPRPAHFPYTEEDYFHNDCLVPLAFQPDHRALRHTRSLELASASVNQTARASAALKTFARCVVPPERLLWWDFRRPAPELWRALAAFAGIDALPPGLPTHAFPHLGSSYLAEAKYSNKGAMRRCKLGGCDCAAALACVVRVQNPGAPLPERSRVTPAPLGEDGVCQCSVGEEPSQAPGATETSTENAPSSVAAGGAWCSERRLAELLEYPSRPSARLGAEGAPPFSLCEALNVSAHDAAVRRTVAALRSAIGAARARAERGNEGATPFRVAVLGGSMTFGTGCARAWEAADNHADRHGVGNHDCAWPARLAAWLQHALGEGRVRRCGDSRRGYLSVRKKEEGTAEEIIECLE